MRTRLSIEQLDAGLALIRAAVRDRVGFDIPAGFLVGYGLDRRFDRDRLVSTPPP